MSNLKEFYKVDQLNAEIRDLKKTVKELESDNRQLNLKVQTGDYPYTKQLEAKIKELENDGGPPEIHSANAVI